MANVVGRTLGIAHLGFVRQHSTARRNERRKEEDFADIDNDQLLMNFASETRILPSNGSFVEGLGLPRNCISVSGNFSN